MADKKKGNIFKRIKRKFTEVRQELKRVIWPTKEKLMQTSAVVLTIIVIAAVFLTLISNGGTAILERVGFYGEVETTTTAETTLAAVTEAAPVETEALTTTADVTPVDTTTADMTAVETTAAE